MRMAFLFILSHSRAQRKTDTRKKGKAAAGAEKVKWGYASRISFWKYSGWLPGRLPWIHGSGNTGGLPGTQHGNWVAGAVDDGQWEF